MAMLKSYRFRVSPKREEADDATQEWPPAFSRLLQRESSWKSYLSRQQGFLSVWTLLVVAAASIFPGVPDPVRGLGQVCFWVSHPLVMETSDATSPGRERWWEQQYERGGNDVVFVLFWIVGLTALRNIATEAVFLRMFEAMDWDRHPAPETIADLARRARVYELRGKFSEQCWQTAYYSTTFMTGLWLMWSADWGFSTAHFWQGYPHRTMPFVLKTYYLVQLAFWIHMVLVILLEVRWRREFGAMLTHHLLTIVLLATSYHFHLVRVGLALLVSHDLCDALLALAKLLKYTAWKASCDVAFAVFAVAWFPTRHVVFFIIYYSVWTEPQKHLDMAWDPSRGKYLNGNGQLCFKVLLALFQLIMLLWLKQLLRAVAKSWHAGGTDDLRSDSETDSASEYYSEGELSGRGMREERGCSKTTGKGTWKVD